MPRNTRKQGDRLVAADPREAALRAMETSLRALATRKPIWTVWSDFLLLASCAISNSCDLQHKEEREEAYMKVAEGYTREEVNQLAEVFAQLGVALEVSPTDILGTLHQRLQLHQTRRAQYFTPWPVAEMMAKMSLFDSKHLIDERGYLTVCEPTAGSGVMLLAFASAMREEGFNFQETLCATAVDIDLTCVHMTYLQLSILGVPARVFHGDSLAGDTWSVWLTPFYVFKGFWYREQRREALALLEASPGEPAPEPPPAPPPPEEPPPEEPPPPPMTQLTLF